MVEQASTPYLFADMLARVHAICAALAKDGGWPEGIDFSRVVVEPPRDPSHGDMATNAAMVLAKEAKAKPRDLAEQIAERLRADALVAKVDVAGPGFINLTLQPTVWTKALATILREGAEYGRVAPVPGAPKVNVEYVSANPTGPMHVGHCRGAVFGDALCSLLQFAGRDVTREYYINDAGAQVDVLASSAFLRYREALGEDIGTIPEGLYPGDYLKPVGQALAAEHGDKLKTMPKDEWLPIVRQAALEEMLIQIIDDLEQLNINFDVFFSEKALLEGAVTFAAPDKRPTFYFAAKSYASGPKGNRGIRAYLSRKKLKESGPLSVEGKAVTFEQQSVPGALGQPDYIGQTLRELTDRGLIYQGRLPPPKGAPPEDWEDREQTLFRSTEFGDDVDRPLAKSDGSYTYFASDIANHRNKYERGFTDLIDVFGADHGGYIKRMQAAVKAVTAAQAVLDVKVVQLVKLLRNGEPVKMSKRSGDFVTLREVVDEVGRDAVRFMMLYRKNDAVLDFDLAKVIEQSRDNPVFYVQYGHARGHSIFRNAREGLPELPEAEGARLAFLAQANLEKLSDPAEHDLLKRLALYPRTVESAAVAHEPHRIAFYLYELASEFHALWTRGRDLPYLRFIIDDDAELTKARLAMVQGVVSVLASGLAILGVNAPDAMR
ncbi:arginine--tRNA ligase [Bradyrhizobium sp. SZCCHNRI20481]|uniref:arginine--tRNA ligase n=1 Tax=Bradyrhizobium sp. SZCCHNRI20481 TaxID=3057286 RepID=UPI002915D9FE|nr:arginine--tRNA ligase [Bradyrhizobium sp. SZCCHNRI20481]